MASPRQNSGEQVGIPYTFKDRLMEILQEYSYLDPNINNPLENAIADGGQANVGILLMAAGNVIDSGEYQKPMLEGDMKRIISDMLEQRSTLVKRNRNRAKKFSYTVSEVPVYELSDRMKAKPFQSLVIEYKANGKTTIFVWVYNSDLKKRFSSMQEDVYKEIIESGRPNPRSHTGDIAMHIGGRSFTF